MSLISIADHPAKWKKISQITWLVFAFMLLWLLAAKIPGQYAPLVEQYERDPMLADIQVPYETLAVLQLGFTFLVVLAHNAVAGFLIWRGKADPIAHVIAFTLSANGAILPISEMYPGDPGLGPAAVLIHLVIYIALVSSVLLLYLFPDGRFVPWRSRWLAGAWMIYALLFQTFADQMDPGLLGVGVGVMLLWPASGIAAQVYRHTWVSTLVQRQQTKWALLGLFAAVMGPAQYVLPFVVAPRLAQVPNLLYQRLGNEFFLLSWAAQGVGGLVLQLATLLFPLSFAIAILHYRLFDIDLVIRRTLVYAILTSALAIIYLSSVVLLQPLFILVTGQQSPAATVLSTLAIAALFTPLRSSIQGFIDRRFYRQKYNAEQALTRFAAIARNEVDLNRLAAALTGVAEETLQPENASLWLRREKL